MNTYNYLALGDSYTIGEQVNLTESFPYQTVQILRQQHGDARSSMESMNFSAPEIIAKTGWTTDELQYAVQHHRFLKIYDFVTLLIGVNNQYRGKNVNDFKREFEQLLQAAIEFAGGKSSRVFVLSIPDWGVTPFAAGKDRQKISAEIDAYNAVCEKSTKENQCIYIDIRQSQRTDANTADFIAADGLHPSGKEYAKWALKLSAAFMNSLK